MIKYVHSDGRNGGILLASLGHLSVVVEDLY